MADEVRDDGQTGGLDGVKPRQIRKVMAADLSKRATEEAVRAAKGGHRFSRKSGRAPSSIPPERQRFRAFQDEKRMQVFLDAFKIGATLQLACRTVRVGESTFQLLKQETAEELAAWERGEGKKPAQWKVDLLDEVEKAKADGHLYALSKIRQAMGGGGPTAFHAAAWMLERSLPNDYGRPWRQELMPTEQASTSGVLVAPTSVEPESWISAQSKSNLKAVEPGAAERNEKRAKGKPR